MNRLYDIDTAILQALDEAEPNEQGEFISAELEALQQKREEKLEAIGLYIKDLENFTKELKAEEQALYERRKAKEKKIEWLKNYVADSIRQFGEVETARILIKLRKSESLEIVNETLIPPEFIITKTTTAPDKVKLKDCIKKGEIIDGVELKTNYNLQIK